MANGNRGWSMAMNGNAVRSDVPNVSNRILLEASETNDEEDPESDSAPTSSSTTDSVVTEPKIERNDCSQPQPQRQRPPRAVEPIANGNTDALDRISTDIIR